MWLSFLLCPLIVFSDPSSVGTLTSYSHGLPNSMQTDSLLCSCWRCWSILLRTCWGPGSQYLRAKVRKSMTQDIQQEPSSCTLHNVGVQLYTADLLNRSSRTTYILESFLWVSYRALLFGVYIRAQDFWKLPYQHNAALLKTRKVQVDLYGIYLRLKGVAKSKLRGLYVCTM